MGQIDNLFSRIIDILTANSMLSGHFEISVSKRGISLGSLNELKKKSSQV